MFHKITPKMRGVDGLFRGPFGTVQICPRGFPTASQPILAITDVAGSGVGIRLVGAPGHGIFEHFIDGNAGNQQWLLGVAIATAARFQLYDNTRGALVLDVQTNGAITISAPTAGNALTASGVASGVVYQATPSATGAGVAFYDATALTVGLVITSSGSDFSKIQNDGANLWSIATNNALATLGTPVFQWSNNAAPKLQGRGPTAAALVDMTPDSGTFTATPTGGTTPITATAVWRRIGALVMLVIPACNITSTGGTFTITGLPAAIQPARAQFVPVSDGAMENGGTTGVANVTARFAAASGTITFDIAGNTAGFTTTSQKGIANPIVLCYHIG